MDASMDNEPLRAFVEDHCGDQLTVVNLSRTAGRQSLVWRIEWPSRSAYLKKHESARLYNREIAALENWTPLLPADVRFSTPRIIAKSDALTAVLLEVVPGEIVAEAGLTGSQQEDVFRMAGACAASLHGIQAPQPAETVDLERALTDELDRLLEQCGNAITSGLRQWARSVVADGSPFAGAKTVPAHHDFSPRNWLAERTANGLRLGVIDWERARFALWLQDAQRMTHDHWAREPQLREAFFDGYGRKPTEREERQLKLITLINSIGAIPWAIERGDQHFETLSRAIVDSLRREL